MVFRLAPRFPPELTDMVLDCLLDDKAALSTTSLVCRSWLSRSRLHLFRHLSVANDFISFAAFLQNTPYLRTYVKYLVLHGHLDDHSTTSPSCAPTTVFLEPIVLSDILSHLPSLHTLQLHAVAFHGRSSPCPSPSFKLNELIMMNVGSLQDTTSDMLNILSLFTDVHHLHIGSTTQTLDADDIPSQTVDLPIPHSLRVSSLKLEDVPLDLYLQLIRQTESVKTLQELEVDCMGLEDAEALSALLHETNSNIGRLAINLSQCPSDGIYSGEEDSEDLVTLTSRAICENISASVSSCTNLSALEIAISLDSYLEDPSTYPDAWDWLSSILHSAPSSSLQQIDISLAAEESFAPLLELNVPWQPLADVLNKFSNLGRVTVANMPPTSWCFSEEEKDVVRRNLPELVQRGLLHVGSWRI
ncbi:hypothetical protein BDW22DRAFT_1488162 [Trametopsis cervina]|nr:hypothetical protein BDW22DRAFT_1488162 [Trametopsis cervina]